jgi:hypothetical protein
VNQSPDPGISSVIPRRSSIVDVVLVTGLIAVAVQECLRVTAGLHVPPDPDLFRSAAISQTMSDGAWTADPFFAGESNWYNPLVPALVAVIHLLTGTPILDLYARGGVVLNLLAPLMYWLLVRALLGSGAAVGAVFAFLFLPPRLIPGWATAGYWPWLFSGVFTQGLFYGGLLAIDRAGGAARLRPWLLAGVALGVVFLGHTAPALVFGGVLVLAAVRLWRHGCPARRAASLLAASLVTACVVALPLILSVVVRYRLTTLNDVLSLYAYSETEPANILGFLRDHQNAGGTLAVFGLALIAFDRERRKRAWVIGYWAVVNGSILLVHFGRDVLDSVGVRVPQIVTAFHFVLYGEAIVTILAGYAIWRMVELSAARLPRRVSWMTPAVVSRVLLVALMVVSVRPALPHRRAREDFDESHQRALAHQSRAGDGNTREWIRAQTMPGDVFLASGQVALYVVAPAGGKVVSLDRVFANPYVDATARDRDQFTMEDRIHENDRAGYCMVASRYRVKYVIADAKRGEEGFVPAGTFLEDVHATDGIRIFRAPDCGASSRRR